jgi:hypothetical protein
MDPGVEWGQNIENHVKCVYIGNNLLKNSSPEPADQFLLNFVQIILG